MSSQHEGSPDLIKAVPDVASQEFPTEIEGIEPLEKKLLRSSSSLVDGQAEDETFVFTFTWACKHFQLELQATDR
jgi:hypothetical protein